MLNQPTIDKLCAMRMRGMAEALQQQMQEPDIHQLSFEERLGLLIDRQWDWRQNRALERRLRNARLQGPACVEDIDYRTPRGLDRAVVRSLTQQSAWVEAHQNLFLVGPTGIGKTWLARAIAQKACRDGYSALFLKAAELFRDLAASRADGSHSTPLYQLGHVDVLIVDDWAISMPRLTEVRDRQGFPLRYDVLGYVEEGGSVSEVLTAGGRATTVIDGAPRVAILASGTGRSDTLNSLQSIYGDDAQAITINMLQNEPADPLADFDVICRELALFSPAVAAKPQIVAANKIDAMESADAATS